MFFTAGCARHATASAICVVAEVDRTRSGVLEGRKQAKLGPACDQCTGQLRYSLEWIVETSQGATAAVQLAMCGSFDGFTIRRCNDSEIRLVGFSGTPTKAPNRSIIAAVA